MNAAEFEACISARTRAVIPVSLYGQCADMPSINALAAQRGIVVIEDAAQSFGASLHGKRSCNLSAIGCTSFFPSKPLGCYGDGGAIFTADPVLAQALREIRVHGQSRRYWHTRVGLGGRMDTLQCAVVLAKMTRFEWELQRRIQVAQRYDEMLVGIATSIGKTAGSSHAYAQYTIRVPHRDAVIRKLSEAGIPTAVHYPVPLNAQPAYAEFAGSRGTPVSVQLAQEVLSLPMSADLTEADQDSVIAALAAVH